MSDVHAQAYSYCAYCPKVCRFSCPVSNATHNEAHSAWGKMNVAYQTIVNKEKTDASTAESLYACTGCGRCNTFCKHNNEVGYALFSARRTVEMPEKVRETVENFRQKLNPFGESLPQQVAPFLSENSTPRQLFAGCSTLCRHSEHVTKAQNVLKKVGVETSVTRVNEMCCGYTLYAAGENEAFVEHAEYFKKRAKDVDDLISLDVTCAYTLKVVYPRFGIKLDSNILNLYEVLSDALSRMTLPTKRNEEVGFHEPCHLARGLQDTTSLPRVVEMMFERVFRPQETGSETGCVGGGGLLPKSMPEASDEMSRREAGRLAKDGAEIISACINSQKQFSKIGLKSTHVIDALHAWLFDVEGAQP